MCRNIHTLFNYEPPATEEEVHASALQYVRKVSGFTKPSQTNEEAFARAVAEVADATQRLLDALVTTSAPRDRVHALDRVRHRHVVGAGDRGVLDRQRRASRIAEGKHRQALEVEPLRRSLHAGDRG